MQMKSNYTIVHNTVSVLLVFIGIVALQLIMEMVLDSFPILSRVPRIHKNSKVRFAKLKIS